MHDPITLLELSIGHAELMTQHQNVNLEWAVSVQNLAFFAEENYNTHDLSSQDEDDINLLNDARDHFATDTDLQQAIAAMKVRT
jgi:hypothetical protein